MTIDFIFLSILGCLHIIESNDSGVVMRKFGSFECLFEVYHLFLLIFSN